MVKEKERRQQSCTKMSVREEEAEAMAKPGKEASRDGYREREGGRGREEGKG